MGALNIAKEEIAQQIPNKSQLTRLYEIFKDTVESEFYGTVEIKFEAGKVTIIRKTESIKL